MSFNTEAYLRRATARAKSDVANKLVSMFLHEVSRKLCEDLSVAVNDGRYGVTVLKIFQNACCYCGRMLENDRAAIEHLDAMNRFRLGLHVPGNVMVACTQCNREKRRDDSTPKLVLAETGWESFLSHDMGKCSENCKSCSYWARLWPDKGERLARLQSSRERITIFRDEYWQYLEISARARLKLLSEVESIYRDCQEFALNRIKGSVANVCGC